MKTIEIYNPTTGQSLAAAGLLPSWGWLTDMGVRMSDAMLWHWHMEGDYYAQASAVLAPYGLGLLVLENERTTDLVWEDWKAIARANGTNTAVANMIGGQGEREYPLSGEFAGDLTVADVYRAIGWPEVWHDDTNEIAEAWEEGYHEAYAKHGHVTVVLTW